MDAFYTFSLQLSLLLFVLYFILLVVAEYQQRKIMKGERRFGFFLGYYKSHKWLKTNAHNLSDDKQKAYRYYLLNRKIQYIMMGMLFILYITHNGRYGK